MHKSELGLISFLMSVGTQEAIRISIYRDGTLIRMGGGSLPVVPVGVVSYWPDNGIFEKLAAKVPQQLLLNDIDYAEENIKRPLVYELIFSGRTTNGMIGDKAEWAKTTAIRFTLDLDTKFRHAVLAFADNLLKDATGFTNSWYFDALIMAIFGQRSNRLPKQTYIAKPDEDINLAPELAVFLQQMLKSQRKWNFMAFPQGKIYTDDQGIQNHLIFRIEGGQFLYNFMPLKEA